VPLMDKDDDDVSDADLDEDVIIVFYGVVGY